VPGEAAGSFGQAGLSPCIREGLEYGPINLGITRCAANSESGFTLQYSLRHSFGVIASVETDERARHDVGALAFPDAGSSARHYAHVISSSQLIANN
jgi:hypothetical protein